MKRRDFVKKSFYVGASTAFGSVLSSDLIWKPGRLYAHSPADQAIIRTHCDSVQDWNFNVSPDNLYHDYINYPVVEDMLNEAVCNLTSRTNVVDAWQDIIGYQSGQKIAIKLNLNCYETSDEDKSRPNQTYQLANATIHSLLLMGVPMSDITVYDVSRRTVDRMRAGLDAAGYAGVEYFALPRDGDIWDDNETMYFPDPSVTRRYPRVLTEADHLINIMLMKGHGSYITGALKNHFGTIEGNNPYRESRSDIHINRQYCIPLLCSSEHIAQKCRLNICEAFFMSYYKETTFYEPLYDKSYFPGGISGYASPNSLLVAKNAVVMDSVLHDLIVKERDTRRALFPSDPWLVEPFVTTFLSYASDMGLGLFESGTRGDTDMSYNQIQYNTIDMPLVTKAEIDRNLRRFKEGATDNTQLQTKVKRYELGF